MPPGSKKRARKKLASQASSSEASANGTVPEGGKEGLEDSSKLASPASVLAVPSSAEGPLRGEGEKGESQAQGNGVEEELGVGEGKGEGQEEGEGGVGGDVLSPRDDAGQPRSDLPGAEDPLTLSTSETDPPTAAAVESEAVGSFSLGSGHQSSTPGLPSSDKGPEGEGVEGAGFKDESRAPLASDPSEHLSNGPPLPSASANEVKEAEEPGSVVGVGGVELGLASPDLAIAGAAGAAAASSSSGGGTTSDAGAENQAEDESRARDASLGRRAGAENDGGELGDTAASEPSQAAAAAAEAIETAPELGGATPEAVETPEVPEQTETPTEPTEFSPEPTEGLLEPTVAAPEPTEPPIEAIEAAPEPTETAPGAPEVAPETSTETPQTGTAVAPGAATAGALPSPDRVKGKSAEEALPHVGEVLPPQPAAIAAEPGTLTVPGVGTSAAEAAGESSGEHGEAVGRDHEEKELLPRASEYVDEGEPEATSCSGTVCWLLAAPFGRPWYTKPSNSPGNDTGTGTTLQT